MAANIITAGTTFIFSSGEYSDYCVRALCRAKQDIHADDLVREFLAANPDQKERYSFEANKFIAFLMAKDLFEETTFSEFHLGDYGDPDSIEVMAHDMSLKAVTD